MTITASMSTARIEAEMARASRHVAQREDIRHEQPVRACEYHEAYATWHKCNAILAARRGDKGDELGGKKWHRARAARHLKLAGGEA